MSNHIKKGIFLLFIFISAVVSAQNSSINGSILTDGTVRSYRIYIPEVYDGTTKVPLVLNFHGYGSTNWQQEIYSNFNAIADTANFIVVYPQGMPVNGSLGWNNFGPISYSAADINFIDNLIDSLTVHYQINENRIYSTGMSNGGFMSYDLACFLSNRIAAIASVTGSMVDLHKSQCNPVRAIPIMQFHGTADPVVTYSGNGGLINTIPMDSLVAHWVMINNITTTPVITDVPDVNTADNSTVKHFLYYDASTGNTVEFYKIINGGHTWPGSPIPISSGNTNRDINASAEIWRFFRQHSLNNTSTGVTIDEEKTIPFSIYTDPIADKIYLKRFSDDQMQIRIYNTAGNLVYENKDFNSNAIQLNEPAGIYIYQIRMENEIFTGKVAL